MKRYYRTFGTLLFSSALALILSGCVLLTPTPQATIAPVEEAAEEATPTAAAVAVSDATPEPKEKPTQESTADSIADPTEEPAAESPRAEVLSATLNIRGGPGTNYPILSAAKQGAQFEVIGQVNGCRWLLVRTNGGEAWISGRAQFSRLNAECSNVPEAPIPAAPEPAPPVAAEPPAEDPLPVDQGCYLFQNQLGPEITITLTSRDRNWTDTFKLQRNEERPYCLLAGRYDYTLDAPPPFGALNGTIRINAGDRFYFPIRPKK